MTSPLAVVLNFLFSAHLNYLHSLCLGKGRADVSLGSAFQEIWQRTSKSSSLALFLQPSWKIHHLCPQVTRVLRLQPSTAWLVVRAKKSNAVSPDGRQWPHSLLLGESVPGSSPLGKPSYACLGVLIPTEAILGCTLVLKAQEAG